MHSASAQISQHGSLTRQLNSDTTAKSHTDSPGLRRQSAVRREPSDRPKAPTSSHPTQGTHQLSGFSRTLSPFALSESCGSATELTLPSPQSHGSTLIDNERTPQHSQSFASFQTAHLQDVMSTQNSQHNRQQDYVAASAVSTIPLHPDIDKPKPPHAYSSAALYHVGLIEGITPPPISASQDDSHFSSVVATGLEMGLGPSIAASALRDHVAGDPQAMSGLAELRFSRPHQATYHTSFAQHDKSQDLIVHSSETSPQSAVLDSDLHRRRTTGARSPKQRFEPVRGTRHQRADTHDPILSRPSASTSTELEKQQYIQNNYLALRNDTRIATPIAHDNLPSATEGVGRKASIGAESSTNAPAGSTAPATPSLGERATLSPDSQLHSINPFAFIGQSAGRSKIGQKNAPDAGNGPTQAALLGLGGGSHFGPGVRAKVSEVLPYLVSSIPLSGVPGETVTIAEYGCLNTRSVNLLQPIISSFVDQAHADATKRSDVNPEDISGDDAGSSLAGATSLLSLFGVSPASDESCRLNFSIIHEDATQADFRQLSQMLNTSSESYLNPQWQATHQPSLQHLVFPSFVARPFASRIAPPSTVHLGLSLMDLHWSHTPRNPAVSLSTSANAELTTFLTARAHEFRKDGVFVMAYIARAEESPTAERPKSTIYPSRPVEADDSNGEETSQTSIASAAMSKHRRRSNSQPNRPNLGTSDAASSDIWATMTNTLAPCLQRLVSCGMLKSDVARHLLSLPMHARTPRQTRNVLKSVRHLWKVEWSCGLGEDTLASPTLSDWQSHLTSEPEPLRLPHPASKALQAGTLSRIAFAEHMIQLFKNLYESHFRVILREKGKLSKGAVEFVLDSLWDVLQSRIDDQDPCPIAQCELEVQVVALRRA